VARTVATIEARMSSSRLPGKVLSEVDGRPMLEHMVERLQYVSELDEIVIATTDKNADDAVAALATRIGTGVWRGSEEDVLARVLDAAKAYDAETIVELTGDCPLVDPKIVSRVIQKYRARQVDYASNVLERTYPIGMDTQVFATSVLDDVARRTADPADREHVSLYIYRHPEIYSICNVSAPPSEARPALRLTLDTPEDLVAIRAIFFALRPSRVDFSLSEIIDFLDAHPDVAAVNASIRHRYV
jgi:spore coat polysaccharide biosynthesis protein SpsF